MPHLLLKDLPKFECLLEAAKEHPELDPTACEVFLNLLRTGDDVFNLVEANFARHHLSQGRFGVLTLLWHSRERSAEGECSRSGRFVPRTPADLAEAAGVTRATMTGLVDTLERDGFVTRDADPGDRRMQLVSLTPKAEDLLRRFLPEHFRVMGALMSPLTESERNTLVRLLNKVSQQASAVAAARATAAADVQPTQS